MTMTREDTTNRLEAGARYIADTDTALAGVMLAAAEMIREDGNLTSQIQSWKNVDHALLADALTGLEPFARAADQVKLDEGGSTATVWQGLQTGDLRTARTICTRLRAALGEQT